MDNMKKKRLDAKRISGQKWEIAYIRKIAKYELLALQALNKEKKLTRSEKGHVVKMIRICKAALKFVK